MHRRAPGRASLRTWKRFGALPRWPCCPSGSHAAGQACAPKRVPRSVRRTLDADVGSRLKTRKKRRHPTRRCVVGDFGDASSRPGRLHGWGHTGSFALTVTQCRRPLGGTHSVPGGTGPLERQRRGGRQWDVAFGVHGPRAHLCPNPARGGERVAWPGRSRSCGPAFRGFLPDTSVAAK